MTHNINLVDNILTIRINGRGNVQEILQELGPYFNNRTTPLTVVLDLTLANWFDQNTKAMFFRVLQHRNVANVGIASGNPALAADVKDLQTALGRVRPVKVANTEVDVLAHFGLADAPTQPRQLSGMLKFLKKPGSEQQ
jgi:hypothetical protein